MTRDVNGYQMVCTHPLHKTKPICQKELAISKAGGSAEAARRMLKQRVVLGKHLGSKDEHKVAWGWVVAQAADGTLPSEEALDRAPVLFAPISG